MNNDKQERFDRPEVIQPSSNRTLHHPSSNRTLHHPSFMPLYLSATGSAPNPPGLHDQTVLPLIPPEFFYTDPTLRPGRRIPNTVHKLQQGFGNFRLNTPAPVMSVRPTRPDPFWTTPQLTKDLGGTAWRMDPLQPPHPPRLLPRPAGQSQTVLQLTQEEDQAVTYLLKLHYQDPLQRHWDGAPTRVNREVAQTEGEQQESRSTGDLPLSSGEEHLTSSSPLSSRSPVSGKESGPSDLEDVLGGLRGGAITESEGAAVRALLSLGDI